MLKNVNKAHDVDYNVYICALINNLIQAIMGKEIKSKSYTLREEMCNSVSRGSSNEPENCPKEYDEDVCDGCEFLKEDPVGMIGGMTGMSAGNRNRCEKGYWKEDV